MKTMNLVPLAFVIGGVVLAYHGAVGWAWCFGLAILTYAFGD